MDARAMRIGIGAAAALCSAWCCWPPARWIAALGAGVIVADVVYALLDHGADRGHGARCGSPPASSPSPSSTYVGIIGFGDFGTQADVDPNTFINAKAANSWALILTIAMVIGAVVDLRPRAAADRRASARSPASSARGPPAHGGRDRGQHHPRPDRRIGAEDPDLPRLDRHDPGRRAVRTRSPGALTGGLCNILWSYVIPPPFQYQPAAAFAIVAVAIGVIAGLAGRAGFLRPRPEPPTGELVAGGVVTVALIGVMAWAASSATPDLPDRRSTCCRPGDDRPRLRGARLAGHAAGRRWPWSASSRCSWCGAT